MEECSEPPTPDCSPDKTIEDTKSPPSDRACSPETNCAICLGKPQNKSFTDSCLHQFCFACLLEWSKVKAECPLCKQSFTSIIHTVRSIEDYQQYYVHSSEPRVTFEDNIWPHDTPFRYRTTVTTSYLEYIVRFESSLPGGPYIIPSGPSHPVPDWRRRRQIGASEFRYRIYNLNLWVQRTRDITGRYRESSPEFYRLNPAQVHRLVPWLNRELEVLVVRNVIQVILDKILDLLKIHPIRSTQFHDALNPYLSSRTDHFLHEFYSFATSPYDMIGYDRNSTYVNHYNLENNFASSPSTDSDVQVVSESVHNQNSHFSSLPGPSGLNPIEIGSDTDTDDCLFVCSVNPQDRVPEVITIESDNEIENPNTNGVTESNVHNTMNENINDPGPSNRPNRKPRTKAQKKQFSSKRRDRSLDSDESDNSVVIDCYRSRKRRIPQRSATANPRIIWYSDSSSNNSTSSDDENDREWNSKKVKKSYKIKKKKVTTTTRKESSRNKRNSKDSKRKSKGTSKHWKKKICRKNREDESSSDDSGPIQHQKRRKSVAINSSPEPEVRPVHDYQITNPYTPREIKSLVSGKPKLRSVVVKNNATSRKECQHTSSSEGIARGRLESSDSSGMSNGENDCEINSGSSKQYIKWRHRRKSDSSLDSSDIQFQLQSSTSNTTWLGRHYIDTFSSLNPIRYNLCSNYNSNENQQDGQCSTLSKLHKRKSSPKDKSEKRKKSS